MESSTLRCVTFFLLVITSSRVALSAISLECGSLQQLCPDDDQPRTCVCNVTGTTLVWDTSVSGQISFGVGTMAGATDFVTSDSGGVFSAVLTERANGMVSSTLMFNPSTIRAANGSATVTCDDIASADVINTTNITVTSADAPSARQLSILNTGCGPDNTSYQVSLQWNDDVTGGPDVSILYYLVEVTSSPPGFVCPQEECNVTTSTTTITGLSCSTEYSFTVRAVNCNGSSNDSETSTITTPTPTITPPTLQQLCFEMDGRIRVLLNGYTSDCYSVTSVNFLYCTNSTYNESLNNDLMIMLPATGSRDSCNVTVMVSTDCGDSVPVTNTTSGDCPMTMAPTTMIPTISSSSSPMSTSDNPGTTSSTGPQMMGLAGIAGGAGGAVAAIAAAALVMAVIFVCMFCPCRCCMPCRRKCCGCCPEEKICCRWGSDDEYCEPTPHVEKQPVLQSFSTETKEKDVETGQPSYPSSAGPMYQDPSTIQRQAAPTGDLYAQPEKPARHQKQKPVEMATYQDPTTIQRQAAPTTGDLYAQPDKPPRQPSGPAPVYSEVNKSNQPSGLVYADLSHSDSPGNVRRPQQVAETVYSEVRESRN